MDIKKTTILLLILALPACSGGKGGVGDPHFSSTPKTPFTIDDESQLMTGPLAQGRIGDALLQNDKIRVVIQKPSKNAGVNSFGGNIIDADRVRSSQEKSYDQFGSIFPFINIEWTANYYNYEVINDGKEDGVKILRAYGKLDVYDYLDLDFVGEVAEGAVGQMLTFSRRFDDRGNPFEIYDDMKGLDHEIVTDYILADGTNYVRIDTTLKNNGDDPVSIPVGDVVNGSGELHFLIPGVGFSPDLMTQAGADTVGLVYEGLDGIDVSYGYFYEFSQFVDEDEKRLPTGSLSFSEVTFVGLGEEILKLLPLGSGTTPKINFSIPPKGSRTFTRYFAVGDGSAGSVLEAGMAALHVDTATVSGEVVDIDGAKIRDARVAIQKKDGGTVTVFRTDDEGRFSGKVPSGPHEFAKLLGESKYRVLVDKSGYHANATASSGTCDPAEIRVHPQGNTEIVCTLGESGRVRLSGPVVDSVTGGPIAARLTIVGEDPSSEMGSAGNFSRLVSGKSGFGIPFGIVDNKYITADGFFGLTKENVFRLEPGVYKLVFSHGVEYTTYEQDITVEPGSDITVENISLNRVVETPGYISADFHLHSVASADSWISLEKRVLGSAAEGMDLLHSSEHDNLVDYKSVINDLERSGDIPQDSFIANIAGDEITPNHYGHMHAYPLPYDPESPTGGALDWSDTNRDEVSPAPDYCMSPAEIGRAVKELSPEGVFQLNHIADEMTSLPVAAGWVTSRFYLEEGVPPLSSYADPVELRLNPHTGDPLFPLVFGTSGLVTDGIDAVEVLIGYDQHRMSSNFIKSTLPTWFNLLNLGLLVTATGSSDSHEEKWNPMSWPRNYIAYREDPRDGIGSGSDFDADSYARAIREHKLLITNGVFITVEATGEDGIKGSMGDMVSGTELDLKITAKAPSWAWFDTINIYANAEPIPIDDETSGSMSGTASNPAEFYKPYHVPNYATEPQLSFKKADGTLENWNEEESLITAYVETKIRVTEDTWVVVLARGTKETEGFRSPFPLVVNVLEDPKKPPASFDPWDLFAFHTSSEVGAFAFGLTNPIFIDSDGDGVFTAKYVKEGTSPIQ